MYKRCIDANHEDLIEAELEPELKPEVLIKGVLEHDPNLGVLEEPVPGHEQEVLEEVATEVVEVDL